ncbi:DNA starvation/stationary phase protection protein [Sphingobacteriaceae bacterium]|nr:DNA starvation/stationary phase protection protein [Sphingobacteriaceae bacterium]
MKPNIGITPENLIKITNALNTLLADEHILYIKTRNAHWNVEGADFHAMHLFFETQYTQLEEMIDDVAERIRSLGHYAVATLKDYLKLTHLTEKGNGKNTSAGFIKELLEDHETIISHLRANVNVFADKYKDVGTSDFITSLLESHEKMAWMLRAHLK